METFSKPLDPTAAHWLALRREQNIHLDFDLLAQACHFADQLGGQSSVPYGISSLHQGLAMADELFSLHCDSQTLAAAIIYPTIHYFQPSPEIIEKFLPPNIAQLASDVKKMEAIKPLSTSTFTSAHQHADNLRKMCLAMVDDVRIVLIKLAEQLVILKYLRHCHPEQQQHIAQQVMNIYAPLANRLGVGQMKWQMEDLAFRYLNTEQYKKISQALKMRRQDREIFINQIIRNLYHLLAEVHVSQVEISGRAKHIYSIYRKIQSKHLDFNQIYDTSAVRILVKELEDCYTVLSIVHTKWPHIKTEFDDYIAKPKPNGYRSIHTVIVSPENINIEIQIRTYQMHKEAELGVAAHWQYKEGKEGLSSYGEKINWLRHVMDWQKEVSSPQGEDLYRKIFADRVYVFTPNGDIFDLEAGATPLDFAYHIHSAIGHRCRGAKVNDMIVPLTHVLKTGDQVTIITGKESQPSRDWLNPTANYLKTNNAKHKVRSWFKKLEQQAHLTAGSSAWEKICRREGIAKSEIEKAASLFKFKSGQELLMAIGVGTMGVATVLNRLRGGDNETAKRSATFTEKIIEKIHPKKREGIQIEGIDNLLTQLAHCCKPIPGDPIVGYITMGRGVTIHQQNCRNLNYTLKRYPERLLKVNWSEQANQSYPVEIHLLAEDRAGLIRDITNVIATEHISLLGINTRVNKLENQAYINLIIEIKSLNPLRKILAQLQQIPGITQVRRL